MQQGGNEVLDGNDATLYNKSNEQVGLSQAIERLSQNEAIEKEQIKQTPGIQDAEARAAKASENPTFRNNSTERKALRDDVAISILDLGSAQRDADGKIVKDKTGETAYDGEVAMSHRADIVIGLPASGKSSVLVDPLSAQYHSRVIDNDMIKAMLPEFDNGIGADAVHKESKRIADSVLAYSISEGENIVLPIVGGDYNKLVSQIEHFRSAGYTVAVHYCDLPFNKALGRALGRYLNTGRYIPIDILYQYGDAPAENFKKLVQDGVVNEYSEYSNDVGFGEKPRLLSRSMGDTGREASGTNGSVGSGLFGRGRRGGSGNDGAAQKESEISGTYREETRGGSGEAGTTAEVNNSVGAAESGFDPYTHAANEYGTIAPGEKPSRIVDVPKSTNGTDRVSKLARTAMEAGVTTDNAVEKMEQRIVKGKLSYEVITNEETRQKAEDWLNGFDSTGDALLKWNKTAGRKKFMGLDDYANGIMLYCELMNDSAVAQERGDTKSRTNLGSAVLTKIPMI